MADVAVTMPLGLLDIVTLTLAVAKPHLGHRRSDSGEQAGCRQGIYIAVDLRVS